ncbi:hypothetical protein FDECE_7898 [Fusarium decemcellulare]|nr:hypothetical protein FDECE_7898 [Fusarium decemcellulare]
MPTIAVPTCLPPTKSGTSSRETSVTTGSQSLTVTSEKDCNDLFLQEVSALPEREPVTSTTTSPTETRMTTMPPPSQRTEASVQRPGRLTCSVGGTSSSDPPPTPSNGPYPSYPGNQVRDKPGDAETFGSESRRSIPSRRPRCRDWATAEEDHDPTRSKIEDRRRRLSWCLQGEKPCSEHHNMKETRISIEISPSKKAGALPMGRRSPIMSKL